MNPIHGKIRGEAIINGDASGGIDVILYAVTPGWGAVNDVATAIDGLVKARGTPFIQSMVGKTITFVESGAVEILAVLSPTTVQVSGNLSFGGLQVLTIAAQESLRVVELDADDELDITDVFISQEKDSEYAVVDGGDGPGRRIAKGRLHETGEATFQFHTPFVCRFNGGTLKYFGHDTGLNVCLIKGEIT